MRYRCGTCGYTSPKWMGFCPQCRSGGELSAVTDGPGRSAAARRGARVVAVSELEGAELERSATGIGELDEVLGGGLVPGAAVLLGGEPGVGKSTLLLQMSALLSTRGADVLMASAEESLEQIGIRARRLGMDGGKVLLASERDVDAIIDAASDRAPHVLVVDSIQAVAVTEVGGAPGGVSQVRESAARLVNFAKESGTVVILVGHVTKDGGIAGPKLLEHSVDVVLHLEGDLDGGLRVLRGLKNRFGPTHRVGLFEMRDTGLSEIADPSGWLVSSARGEAAGSVVFPAIDGRRPLLVEVQALVARSSAPQPRRSVKGLEAARVHQLIAVLERHADLSFSGQDVYVSVVGGLRLRDPGADLPVAMALASSLLDRPLGPIAAWGEVGLTGEVRPVAHGEHRAGEAKRLGVDRSFGPNGSDPGRIETVLARAGLLR